MGRYFYLQIKRLLRLLPLALIVVAILFGSLTVIYGEAVKMMDDSESHMKIKIGMVGTVGDTYLELGLAALETLDSSKMAMDIEAMDEETAKRGMESGELAAYLVIPEGFVQAALRGEILPLKYVCTSGAVGVVSMMKGEITDVISDILIHAQKGIYGAANALIEEGASPDKAYNDLSIQYVKLVLARNKVYSVKEIGTADELGMESDLLCGLWILFLMLTCLPFASMLVKRDFSLGRMLAAQRKPVWGQVLCEFAAYLLGLLAILVILLASLSLMDISAGIQVTWKVALHALPIILMVAALSFLFYEMAGDLISGVLLQFFMILVLGFISGCMYPIYFFAETVQKIARYLPAGIAREQLSGCFTGVFSGTADWLLLGYAAVFLTCALVIRRCRVKMVRG